MKMETYNEKLQEQILNTKFERTFIVFERSVIKTKMYLADFTLHSKKFSTGTL